MPQNASEIMVGASGAVYIAPTGTALPTDIATALNAAFKDVGLLTEDGVNVESSMEQEILRSWQVLGRVRTIVTARDFQVSFAMQQWNETTLPFAFGGGTVTSAGTPVAYTYDFPDDQVRDVRAMVIEWADGTKDFRLVIPEIEVTDMEAFSLVKNAEAALGVTGTVISNPSAAFTMRLITDDPGFAV